MATILAPTQKLPRLPPRREWRAKRATPCQAEAMAIFALGRELLPRRPPGYTGVGSTREHHNITNSVTNMTDASTDLAVSGCIHVVVWNICLLTIRSYITVTRAVEGPTFDQKGPTFRLCHGTQRQIWKVLHAQKRRSA